MGCQMWGLSEEDSSTEVCDPSLLRVDGLVARSTKDYLLPPLGSRPLPDQIPRKGSSGYPGISDETSFTGSSSPLPPPVTDCCSTGGVRDTGSPDRGPKTSLETRVP